MAPLAPALLVLAASRGECWLPGLARPTAPGIACEALYRPFPGWVMSLEAWSPALRVEGHSVHRCRRDGSPPPRP